MGRQAPFPVQHDTSQQGCPQPRRGGTAVSPRPLCTLTTRSPAVRKPRRRASALRLAGGGVGSGGAGQGEAVPGKWLVKKVCYTVVYWF